MSKHAPESQRSKIIPEIKDYSEEKLLKNHREGPHSIPQHNCPSRNSTKPKQLNILEYVWQKIFQIHHIRNFFQIAPRPEISYFKILIIQQKLDEIKTILVFKFQSDLS